MNYTVQILGTITGLHHICMSKCTELLLYDLLIINSVNEKFNECKCGCWVNMIENKVKNRHKYTMKCSFTKQDFKYPILIYLLHWITF